MAEVNTFAYDNVLYPNYLHRQTHPDRLMTLTKIFGVNPKPVENCRVLELGCGTGSSMLSFAYDLPGSEFIGIDLSEKQIEVGNIPVKAIGLENMKLIQGDIMQINRETFGEFDYIIAHGLYSWVPEPVRDQILKICDETLSENGVALISYNTLPGCHFRQMVREMMQFHTRNTESPIDKVSKGLGILKFVADSSSSDSTHRAVLQKEFKALSEANFQNVFHDDLAEFNHPVYFHEFAAHAEKHNLQFVTEIESITGAALKYPEEVRDVLNQISDDVIALEQFQDYIKNRRFRQSLLCRKNLKISRQPDKQVLRKTGVSSPLFPVSEKPELTTMNDEGFKGHNNAEIEMSHPLTKAAFCHLAKIWPRSVPFDALVKSSGLLLNEEAGKDVEITENDEQVLTDIIFSLLGTGMMFLQTHEPQYTLKVSEKPLASPIARWQAENNSQYISSLFYTSGQLDDKIGKALLKLTDGTRDRAQLLNDLTEFVMSSSLDQPTEIKKRYINNLPEMIEERLHNFAGLGLLVS